MLTGMTLAVSRVKCVDCLRESFEAQLEMEAFTREHVTAGHRVSYEAVVSSPAEWRGRTIRVGMKMGAKNG